MINRWTVLVEDTDPAKTQTNQPETGSDPPTYSEVTRNSEQSNKEPPPPPYSS